MKYAALFWIGFATVFVFSGARLAADTGSRVFLFGHDEEDLRRAAAENRGIRHEKDSTDPVLVEFTVTPEPHLIMLFTADGTFDLDWLRFDPGPTSTMEIPPGTYEVFFSWRDSQKPIFRISILENTEVSATNNSIEMDGSTVEHELRLVPIAQDGLLLPDGLTTHNRTLRREGCGIPIFQSVGYLFAVNVPWDTGVVGAFSTLSDSYSFETFNIRWDTTCPMCFPAYSYSASFRGGIANDVTVETDPNQWREFTVSHHPEPGVDSLMEKIGTSNSPFANLPEDQLGASVIAICFGEAGTALERPLVQTFYRYPRDDPESTVGFLRLRMFEDVGSCGSLLGVRPLYQPPYIALDTGPKGYLLGSSVPVYEPAGNTFHTGLGPAYWFGKIDDRGDEIGISSSHGFLLIPFLDQTGSRPGYSGPLVPYELYQDDTLMESGVLPFNDEDDEAVLALDEPGEHTLVLSYDDYWMEQTQGLTTVAVTFGAGADDVNPPYLMRLAVRAAGTEVAHLQIPGGTVEFLATDDSSGIAAVSAWLDTDSGRNDLTVYPLGDGRYRIETETCGFIIPEGTLSILVEDAAGNKLETGMRMPLRRVARDDEAIDVE